MGKINKLAMNYISIPKRTEKVESDVRDVLLSSKYKENNQEQHLVLQYFY